MSGTWDVTDGSCTCVFIEPGWTLSFRQSHCALEVDLVGPGERPFNATYDGSISEDRTMHFMPWHPGCAAECTGPAGPSPIDVSCETFGGPCAFVLDRRPD